MDTQASVTARVDENDKRPFGAFCSGIGLNTTAAINLYIKGFSSGTPDFL